MTPWQISNLYLDDLDMYGIYWWASKIDEENSKIKPKK